MNDVNKDQFWVEGRIAEWQECGYGDQRYLIERVTEEKYASVDAPLRVSFRKLSDWQYYPNDCRGRDRRGQDGKVIIREPTDEELALIAKKRLLGE